MIVVVGEVALVIWVESGLDPDLVHVPVPVAAIVAIELRHML